MDKNGTKKAAYQNKIGKSEWMSELENQRYIGNFSSFHSNISARHQVKINPRQET